MNFDKDYLSEKYKKTKIKVIKGNICKRDVILFVKEVHPQS